MAEVEEITKYLTSDGAEHGDLEKALERQAIINFKGWYNGLRGGEVLSSQGYCEEPPVDPDVLSAWVLENKAAILTLLGYEDMI